MKRREVFFHLARLFAEWPEWDDKEYAYKAALGHRLADARDAFLGSDCEGWCTDVVAVLDDPTNNIIDWRERDTLTKWIRAAGPEDAKPVFEAIWTAGPTSPRWRISDFLAALPPKAGRTRGVRLNIASFLIGGCGVEEHPPMRITLFREAWEALGYPGTKANADPPSIYDQALRNFDRLCEDAADRNLELRNRLDAQGLVWSVMHWDREDPFVQQWSNEDRTRLAQLRGA